jgi:hypothetical protein
MSQKSVKFHIKSDDYFGTLATVLSIIKQNPEHIKEHIKFINKIEKDLMFLQKKYRITKNKNI